MKKDTSVTILMTQEDKTKLIKESRKQGFDDLSTFIRWFLKKELK
jgi:hypothetical protein